MNNFLASTVLANGVASVLPPILLAVALVVFGIMLVIMTRYKKCPSDKIMVIYGKVGSNEDGTARSAKCIHGGAAFVVPVFQSFEYLDLTPMSIPVDLTNALSHQNIRVDVPSRFTVGISTTIRTPRPSRQDTIALLQARVTTPLTLLQWMTDTTARCLILFQNSAEASLI